MSHMIAGLYITWVKTWNIYFSIYLDVTTPQIFSLLVFHYFFRVIFVVYGCDQGTGYWGIRSVCLFFDAEGRGMEYAVEPSIQVRV